MSTSLAQQLQRLAVPQSVQLRRNDKTRPSILFDPKEAANISKETIYQIAVDGIEELKSKNLVFSSFEQTLFHVTAKQFERSVQTSEANDKLNKTICRFLHLIAPYFLTSAAHKALEWLVYRYHVHEYNTDALIMLILPYHDTNIFVKVLQIIEIQKNDKWLWLKPLQRPGVHLSKQILYNHAKSNPGFLQLITDNLLAAIKEHDKPANLTVSFNFYCSTFAGAIVQSKEIEENVLLQILPSISKGLNSDIPDFCAAAYIIVSNLLNSMALSDKVLDLLLEKLTELNIPILKTEGLLVIIVLYQSQPAYINMPAVAVRNLAKKLWLAGHLRELADSGCVFDAFLHVLLQSGFKIAMDEVATACCQTLIESLISTLKLDASAIHIIFNTLTTLYDFQQTYPPSVIKWMKNIVQSLERQYPEAFDKEVSLLLHGTTGKLATHKRKALQRILQNANLYGQIEAFDKIYHPQIDIRKAATRNLLKMYHKLNVHEQLLVASIFTDRLNDDDLEIAREALMNADKIALDSKEFQKCLVKMLYKYPFSNLIPSILEKLFKTRGVFHNYEVAIALIPYLMPFKKNHLTFATLLLQEYCAKSPMFSEFYKATKRNNCTTCIDLWSYLSAHLGKIKLDTTEIINVQAISENKNETLFKYAVCQALGYFDCEYHNDAMELFLSFFSSTEIKHVKEDSDLAHIKVAQHALPLQGYLKCMQKYIEKGPAIKLATYDCSHYERNAHGSLFTFLLNGAFHSKMTYVKEFGKVMKVVLNKFASGLEAEFLLCIAAANCGSITSATRVRALKSAKSVIGMKGVARIDLVVPSLLSCLMATCKELRILALETIHLISCLPIPKPYLSITTDVLNMRQEIATDHEQVSLVLEQCKNYKIMEKLLDTEDMPVYIKTDMALLAAQLNNLDIYKKCIQLALNGSCSTNNTYRTSIIHMCIERFTVEMACETKKNSELWSFVCQILKEDTVQENQEVAFAVRLLNKIDREIFGNFVEDIQFELLDVAIELATTSINPDILPAVAKLFKHIDLNALSILKQLEQMRDAISPKLQSKVRRRVNVLPTPDVLELAEWKKGVSVLELIQEKKKVRNIAELIPVFFGILKKCLDFDEQANVEYPKQLVLSSLLYYCDKIDPREMPQTAFNMELVVQCIRASQNPQTHHHALLLLAKVATFMPNQVLLHIMTIFTFMGSSVLRHDDAYSFQIISKIIETIIPILVNKREGDIVNVLRVFVDVMLDVPEHRRLPLYRHLLEQIGAKMHLHMFILLICEAQVVLKTSKDGIGRLDAARSICICFAPEVVLSACAHLIEYVKMLPVDKENFHPQKALHLDVFDIQNSTPKQFRHYKYSIVLFISNLLANKELVDNVAKLSNVENQQLEELHNKIIVSVLTYIQNISKVADLNLNAPQAQYWKVMLHHTYDILDSLNALLTPQMFLLVVKGLMMHKLGTVKRRTLELLNNKLQHNPAFFDAAEKSDLFAMIPPLIVIVKQVEKQDVTAEDEVIIQTALLSLKLFIRLLAAENKDKFVQILNFITELVKTNLYTNILASAVLCIAELCSQLRSHSIGALNSFMPILIKIFRRESKEEQPTLLLLSTLTTFQKILDVLSLFLTPYLENILGAVCNTSSKWGYSTDPKLASYVYKLQSIQETLGNLPARILIPTVNSTYRKILEKRNYRAVQTLMHILGQCLSHLGGPELQQILPELITFFLNALEFRTTSTNINDIQLVENELVNTLISLAMKLSETSFRPFYYKMYDWAIRSNEKSVKTITYYAFSHRIATSLKGLFVLFAGHFIANACNLVDACNSNKNDTLYFDNEEDNIELLNNVLQTINMVCQFDTHKFVNKERFDLLMQPLVDQLDNTLGEFEERVRDVVIPTIVNFTVATADDALWKQMNYQILLKTRDSNPKIRKLALKCLSDVCSKVGEDFLPLLPETIPFLAELLEDEEEEIETACQRTIKELEKVLGEPLQKYF